MTFTDSRRLTGPSLLLDGPGAALEVTLPDEQANMGIAAWKRHLGEYLTAVGWGGAEVAVRRYPGGATLAVAAPLDALYAATEVNEAAWETTVAEIDGGEAPDFAETVARLRQEIGEEQNPALRALAGAAAERDVTLLSDDDAASVGLGRGSRTWVVDALPAPDEVDWEAVHDVPVALVTGTNGKSTTVRLLTAVAEAAGLTCGRSTTDYVAIGDDVIEQGDYSGPGGARAVLRDTRTDVGVLEVARGGILRRGLGTPRARAAAVTNVAADHLGEYGIETVEALAEAKFVVAKALGEGGVLVTNAEDAHCVREAERLRAALEARGARVCWTALDPDHERLRGAALACAVVDGHLAHREDGGDWVSVVPVAELPFAAGGAARYNVRNALTVLGLARALGLPDVAVAEGLRRFESRPETNPGRGNVFEVNGARVWVDFAHNPHGLSALVETLVAMPARRRLVLLGQAGDRADGDITALAEAAARLRADRYLVMELPSHLRGREAREVPALIGRALRASGIPEGAIAHASDPLDGVRQALAWAEPGDLLLLLVLSRREEAIALIREAAVCSEAVG